MKSIRRTCLYTIALSFFICASALAQPQKTLNSAELALALKKLNVLGSVLYVAAHPDDENTALLSYLSSERLLRTAYLSTTRGDGGQNLIGTEKGDLMGLIRTQELLAARRIDGAEQFFTRAIDFGYSKSPEEAIRIWGRDEIISDMVWIIRKFRPDVILTRFTPEIGGHGHHRASAILVEEAFHASGDRTRFPDQLKHVELWQPKRILWNVFRRGQSAGDFQSTPGVRVDLGAYNPLLGKSYTEISALSRTMHKSQGFGDSGRRGRAMDSFTHTAGDEAQTDLFEGIDLSWGRVPGGGEVGRRIQAALAAYDSDKPAEIIPHLLSVYQAMDDQPEGYWIRQKKKELLAAIRSAAGLWIEAIAGDYSTARGAEIKINLNLVNRSSFPFTLARARLPFQSTDFIIDESVAYNQPYRHEFTLSVPQNQSYTQPYWLRAKGTLGLFNVGEQILVGLPETAPMSVEVTLFADDQELTFSTPIIFRWTDRVAGEQYRPVEIIPAVAINTEEKLYVFSGNQSKEVGLQLKAGRDKVSGTLRLQLPDGWRVNPESLPFTLEKKDEESRLYFSITPPEKASTGNLLAQAHVGREVLTQGLHVVDYPHIPKQTLFPRAEAKLLRLDLQKNNERIAYIMGSGDEVPAYLEQLGYAVDPLTDADLDDGDLDVYDTIIAGVRAYNTRPRLRQQHKRLMNYVYSGGTYIIQYNTSRGLVIDNLGPYPLRLSRDRVSVEDAPVTLNLPGHPLLNRPNKITLTDFEGWIQERGLYFADQWDKKYETPISSHDPGETEKFGSIVYGKYGEGVFIYTGLSWFRELPAGIPGAYRLFVNLISAGSAHDQETN